MKKYRLYSTLDLVQIGENVSNSWQEENTFQTILKQHSTKPLYFYEGPPGTNGTPGIHHVFTRTIKDLLCRYKTMRGYQVQRKAGWDTHGLPVELAVEKELGITKDEIGKKISLADYNKACKKSVVRHQKAWEKLTRRIGYWLDLDNPYLTYDVSYIETLWGLFQRLYEKGLVYQGYNIQPYSPAAGTGLSSHEINQPGCYKEVKDISMVAQFRVKHLANTYLLAWTTTPWTLPANSALAIHPKITYVTIKTINRYTHEPINVVLAESAIERHFDPKGKNEPLHVPKEKNGPMPWRIMGYQSAKELKGWTYEQLMPYIEPKEEGAFRVVEADFVTAKEGTGIVHIAPTFGSDDFIVAQKSSIPFITVTRKGKDVPIVDEQGRYVEEIKGFAGQYVKADYASKEEQADPNFRSVDLQIAIQLKKEGKAFLVSPYLHNYPHCWRTGKPIIYYPLKAWFIRTTRYKKRLTILNNAIKWHPNFVGEGRFAKWLETLVDWNVSRSRFWGTPLPIWSTRDRSEFKCIGSLQELRKEVIFAVAAGFMDQPLPEPFDPHRPHIDDIVLVSRHGQKMYRENDVLDVWFDAGGMFWAQNVDKNKILSLPPNNFPAHFISEGLDQTRGWFYTLHVLSVLLYNRVAYENVLVTGLVLDKEGNKMSKRLGNTIDPLALLDIHGADVIRWYFITNANPWDNVKFDPNALDEVKRKFFGTLHNTYQFFALYANLDGFFTLKKIPTLRHATRLDRWILSRLARLTEETIEAYDSYCPTLAGRAIQQFVIDDLSNWYVRLNRKRFWQGGYSKDKETAYQTLKFVLATVAQLAAPIAPFYMDQLYKDLQMGRGSVHATLFPTLKNIHQDKALERQMDYAKTISSLTHSLRKQHHIKVRTPLSRILIPLTKEVHHNDIKVVTDIICHETNVKKVEFVTDTLGIVEKQVKPNFQRLGKQYGKHIKAIKEALAGMSQKEINTFEKQGSYTLELQEATIPLTLDDVIMATQDMSGWALATQEALTIALDITLTPALIEEGLAREIVNRLQHIRKEKGFAVEDKVNVFFSTKSEMLSKAINQHAAYIQQEVQALTLVSQPKPTAAYMEVRLDDSELWVHMEAKKRKNE